ncbi:MAG: serine/threonine protein kinase, partial [Myxococcales bacterium]|nr:serine/threonine protein kinase [Myxococcales bacterium]
EIVELERAQRGFGGASTQNLRDSAKAWVGKIVAQRYRIEGIIGIGGMGAVFRAQHLALGKTFALKILHRIYTRDADIVSRFMREARAATQTGHPNIIDIIDIGTTDDDDVYFVMELLEGRTLGEVLHAEGRLAVRRAVHIARQICRAVAAAHEVGIIHRDLKSDNVILITRGKDPDFVKVLDFGICKTSTSDGNETSPGVVMGSPDYMAPEQGAGLDATVASDVYAVGCVVYETLAGRLPFKGRNAIDVLMQKGAREADRVTKYRPEVPAPLADVLARCLMRSAHDRPPSMRALEYELTRAVDGRATAVAAVLGLNMEGDSGPQPGADPSPASSSSFNRAAIASLGAHPPDYDPPERTVVAAPPGREHTQIAPVPVPPPPGAITAASVRASSYLPLPVAQSPGGAGRPPPRPSAGSGVAAGLKAMAFVLLGGLLASGLLLAL